jgi:hypothetical protein
MTVDQLAHALNTALTARAYLRRLEIIDHTSSVIKARLQISPELFVQVYRNDRFDTTNFALIHNNQRIYARDQVAGHWHRHNRPDPDLHDTTPAGRLTIDLAGFLDEVETILASIGLP